MRCTFPLPPDHTLGGSCSRGVPAVAAENRAGMSDRARIMDAWSREPRGMRQWVRPCRSRCSASSASPHAAGWSASGRGRAPGACASSSSSAPADGLPAISPATYCSRALSRARPRGRCRRRCRWPAARWPSSARTAPRCSRPTCCTSGRRRTWRSTLRSGRPRSGPGWRCRPASSATTRSPPPSPRTGNCWPTSRTPSGPSAFASGTRPSARRRAWRWPGTGRRARGGPGATTCSPRGSPASSTTPRARRRRAH